MKITSFSAILTSTAVLAVATCANATIYTYTATMDGPSESPANASPGTGSATIIYDDIAKTLGINANFTGLTGTTTQAHIHGLTASPFLSTAGVAVTPGTLPGFPTGVTSGTYLTTLDLTQTATYTSTFITNSGGTVAGAEAALFSGFNTGRTYFNIHSSTFGGGEIRGFIVPEPSSLCLAALTCMALAGRKRRNRPNI